MLAKKGKKALKTVKKHIFFDKMQKSFVCRKIFTNFTSYFLCIGSKLSAPTVIRTTRTGLSGGWPVFFFTFLKYSNFLQNKL